MKETYIDLNAKFNRHSEVISELYNLTIKDNGNILVYGGERANVKKLLEKKGCNRNQNDLKRFKECMENVFKYEIKATDYKNTTKKLLDLYLQSAASLGEYVDLKLKLLRFLFTAMIRDLKKISQTHEKIYDTLNTWYTNNKGSWQDGTLVIAKEYKNWFRGVFRGSMQKYYNLINYGGRSSQVALTKIGWQQGEWDPGDAYQVLTKTLEMSNIHGGTDAIATDLREILKMSGWLVRQIMGQRANVYLLNENFYAVMQRNYSEKNKGRIEYTLGQLRQTKDNCMGWVTHFEKEGEKFTQLIEKAEERVEKKFKKVGLNKFVEQWVDAYEAVYEGIKILKKCDYKKLKLGEFKEMEKSPFESIPIKYEKAYDEFEKDIKKNMNMFASWMHAIRAEI